jgi:hypothetical protein
MKITLKDEVWEKGVLTFHDGEKASIRYRFKDKLEAKQCDCCGKVYKVEHGRHEDAKIVLNMSKVHPSCGSNIWLDICSVGCGLELADGAWQQTTHDPMDDDGAHPFVTIGATCQNYKLNVQTDLISQATLIENWEASGKKPELLPRAPSISHDGIWIHIRGGNAGEGYTVEIEREIKQ